MLGVFWSQHCNKANWCQNLIWFSNNNIIVCVYAEKLNLGRKKKDLPPESAFKNGRSNLPIEDDLLPIEDDLLLIEDDLLPIEDHLLPIKDYLLYVEDYSIEEKLRMTFFRWNVILGVNWV